MKYQVLLIQEAEDDLFDIYRYILMNDTEERAEYVFDQIEKICNSLDSFPERGHVPTELESIGVKGYYELHFKPYRIIYEIEAKKVFIHCILDGRRDIQELLERRIIR